MKTAKEFLRWLYNPFPFMRRRIRLSESFSERTDLGIMAQGGMVAWFASVLLLGVVLSPPFIASTFLLQYLAVLLSASSFSYGALAGWVGLLWVVYPYLTRTKQ